MKLFSILFVTGLVFGTSNNLIADQRIGSDHFSLPCQNTFNIIMEDDIFLRVESGNPNDPIVLVEVFHSGLLVYTNHSCGSSVCMSDLSYLSSGNYQVIASSNQQVWCATVHLK